MDAGLAAVLAAGITAAVSLAAVWGGFLVARLNVKAMRQQIQDQAATEHAHWLRDRRADACLRYIEQGTSTLLALDAAEETADAATVPSGATMPQRHDLHDQTRDRLYNDLTGAMAALDTAVSEIRLVAPALVDAAKGFQVEVQDYVRAIARDLSIRMVPESRPGAEPLDGEVWEESRRQMEATLRHFTDSAATLLATVPTVHEPRTLAGRR